MKRILSILLLLVNVSQAETGTDFLEKVKDLGKNYYPIEFDLDMDSKTFPLFDSYEKAYEYERDHLMQRQAVSQNKLSQETFNRILDNNVKTLTEGFISGTYFKYKFLDIDTLMIVSFPKGYSTNEIIFRDGDFEAMYDIEKNVLNILPKAFRKRDDNIMFAFEYVFDNYKSFDVDFVIDENTYKIVCQNKDERKLDLTYSGTTRFFPDRYCDSNQGYIMDTVYEPQKSISQLFIPERFTVKSYKSKVETGEIYLNTVYNYRVVNFKKNSSLSIGDFAFDIPPGTTVHDYQTNKHYVTNKKVSIFDIQSQKGDTK